MGRRRIEMFQYRQVLVRLRARDSLRDVARSGLMGRDKLGVLRAVALQHGWLNANAELPDEQIAAAGARAHQATAEVPVGDLGFRKADESWHTAASGPSQRDRPGRIDRLEADQPPRQGDSHRRRKPGPHDSIPCTHALFLARRRGHARLRGALRATKLLDHRL